MAKYFKINGKDFTRFFVPYNLHMISYEPVNGSNAGYMLDGTEYTDEIKVNTSVSIPCMPLKEEQLTELLMELYKNEYVDFEYYEPRIGDYRIISAKRSITQATFLGELPGGDYYKGMTVTFKERKSDVSG